VTKKQGALGPLAVGGPALHDSAIFARFYAAANSQPWFWAITVLLRDCT
jgi:hypothetical protein